MKRYTQKLRRKGGMTGLSLTKQPDKGGYSFANVWKGLNNPDPRMVVDDEGTHYLDASPHPISWESAQFAVVASFILIIFKVTMP